jgi:hypothetical protein
MRGLGNTKTCMHHLFDKITRKSEYGTDMDIKMREDMLYTRTLLLLNYQSPVTREKEKNSQN